MMCKHSFRIISQAVLAIGLMLSGFAASAAVISLDPVTQTVANGAVFSIDVIATDLPDSTTGGSVNIGWTSGDMNLDSVAILDPLTWNFSDPGTIDNAAGTLTNLTFGAFPAAAAGTYTLATLNFTLGTIGAPSVLAMGQGFDAWVTTGNVPITPISFDGATVNATIPVYVDLSGTIKTLDGTNICAMVLASGQYTFSCNPPGEFSLTGLPQGTDGTVKRQIYADGFFPKIDILTESTSESLIMTRSGACPTYNTPYDPAFVPDSAGKRIDISGSVLLQNSQTPICAMVLANGQYMFTCDGSGSYALSIPLDTNGQFKLQVYADGFAPTIQTFDEFSPSNDVHMARAAECQ